MKIKSPKELMNELTPLGKLFFWWILPLYYVCVLLGAIFAITFYGMYSAFITLTGR